MPGSTISIAATSAVRSPPILNASAVRSRDTIWSAIKATLAEPLRVTLPTGTVYNTDAPTQGVVSLMILALFARLGVQRSGRLRSYPRPGRSDQARLAHARPRRHRSDVICPTRSTRVLDDRFIAGEAMKIDRNKAAPWPLAARGAATRSGWAPPTQSASSSPISNRSIGNSAPAACCRRTGVLMQNRGASFSLEAGALNYARARTAAVPHAQSGARRAQRRPHHGLWLHGRRRPAADARRRVHAPCAISASRCLRRIDRPRWVLGRTWGAPRTALRLEPRFDGNLVDRLAAAGHDVEVLPDAYSDVMGHAGAAVLHQDGPAKPRTIRAPMAARRGVTLRV